MVRGVVALTIAILLAGAVDARADEVTIGIVTATSGPLAAPGKFQRNGFALAADTLNKDGGIKIGEKTFHVALKEYDTHCSPAEGASAMQRLVSVDKVPVVLGELCSPVVLAEQPIAEDAQVPFISTVPTAEDLTKQGNDFYFRVNADNAGLNDTLVKYVIAQKLSPLGFIAWNNDAGRGGVKSLQSMMPADVKTGYVGYFNVGEMDFSAHVTNLRNSGDRAVVLLMDEEPGALAIRQIRDAGLDLQLLGTLAMGSDRFLTRLGAKYVAGMVQYDAFPQSAPIPRIHDFNVAYKARFGEESHAFAAQSYDGLMVAAKAISEAGTITDGAAIRKALAGITYDGVIGRIKFDAHGQANPPAYLTQWCDNGTRKIIAPADLAGACGGG